jgi:hypothetical protein
MQTVRAADPQERLIGCAVSTPRFAHRQVPPTQRASAPA